MPAGHAGSLSPLSRAGGPTPGSWGMREDSIAGAADGAAEPGAMNLKKRRRRKQIGRVPGCKNLHARGSHDRIAESRDKGR